MTPEEIRKFGREIELMTPEEIRKFAIEAALKMGNTASAEWMISEAKKIEAYILEKPQ